MKPGDSILVEKLPVEKDADIELDKVLLIADGDKVITGRPTIPQAKVIATSLGEKKSDKIIVFKYKRKVRYRRKAGHKQIYTRLKVKEIICNQPAS